MALTVSTGVVLDPDTPELRDAARTVVAGMRVRTALPLPFREPDDARPGDVRVRLTGGTPDVTGLGLTPTRPGRWSEAYALRVTREGALLEAEAVPGVLEGLRTLDQLDDGTRRVPAVSIDDAPRFSYRGVHLDVARHYFPVEFVLRYVDLLARYKLNTFHWHLTDDQGWRIEIRRYPRLTRVGGFRKQTLVGRAGRSDTYDGVSYGGYYTQAEIRRVVAYAAQRGITVIPEIEMPGHARAALAAYPELACTPGPFTVATTWGVFPEIFCPSEVTFRFLENVLDEVMELFPSEYIHIGGDEAPKAAWEASPLAQEVMRREGLADEAELQSWFVRRIEGYLRDHGRRLVGWDEILEGGLAPQATVMSWRGEAGGIEAARQGHDVIMTPNPVAYLDHYQGDPEHEPLAIGGYTPLEEVYAWEPVPAELTGDETRHVLGAQGNMWTEYMASGSHVEYMLFPRLLALSEVLWSPRDSRDLEGFRARVSGPLAWLGAHGVDFRIPEPVGLGGASDAPPAQSGVTTRLVLGERIRLAPRSLVRGGRVLVTLDGSEPDTSTAPWRGAREVAIPADGLTVTGRVLLPDGRLGPVRAVHLRTAELRPASPDPGGLTPGLRWQAVAAEGVESVDELADGPPLASGTTGRVAVPEGLPNDAPFGVRYTGWIRVPDDGIYTFHVTSDDGSALRVDDEVVVDNDGPHGAQERTGQVALQAGLHRLSLLYFQAGGGLALELSVTPPGGARTDPSGWLLSTGAGGARP